MSAHLLSQETALVVKQQFDQFISSLKKIMNKNRHFEHNHSPIILSWHQNKPNSKLWIPWKQVLQTQSDVYMTLTILILCNSQTWLWVYKGKNHFSSAAAFLLCEETKGESLIWLTEVGETLSSSSYWHNHDQHISSVTKWHQPDIMITNIHPSTHISIPDAWGMMIILQCSFSVKKCLAFCWLSRFEFC